MFEAVGHAVSRLIRIRYGAMMLPRGLKRGAWLELDEHDIRALMQAAGVPADAGGGARAGRNGRRGERKPMGAKMQGEGRGKAAGRAGRSSGSSQPDPMKTSVGYIGADSFSRHRQQQQRGGGSRRGGR